MAKAHKKPMVPGPEFLYNFYIIAITYFYFWAEIERAYIIDNSGTYLIDGCTVQWAPKV
jgi:hypothetical protein